MAPLRMTTTTRIVLETLKQARSGEPVWGYRICEQSGLGPGTVYPILTRLESAGHITGTWETSAPVSRPRRRLYTLTSTGLQLAAGHSSPARVPGCGGEPGRYLINPRARKEPIMPLFRRGDVSPEGWWEPDGAGVRVRSTGSSDVVFRHVEIPDARIFVTIGVCDMDPVPDGGFGVSVVPSWSIFEDPGHTEPWDPKTFDTCFFDADPLPQVYDTMEAADEAAEQLAEAVAAGDRSALDEWDQDLVTLIYEWDGRPFGWDEEEQ